MPGFNKLVKSRRVWTLALCLGFSISVGVVGHILTNSKTVPGNLPEQDKADISRLLHWHTVRAGFDALSRGEFRVFARSARTLPRQRIEQLDADPDGTYTARVVINDKSAPDGGNLRFQYQLGKTNGHWAILRSY